jgi:hypothetical protein
MRMSFTQAFGEKSGDIPIYSLHRIKTKIQKGEISIGRDLGNMLFRNLVKANRKYREESGNNWNCLTSLNLVNAIEKTDEDLQKQIELAEKEIGDKTRAARQAIEKMHKKRKEIIEQIRNWFSVNYEDLLYDMRGAIPWPVVCRLRSDLARFSLGVFNPFDQNIEDMIMEVAKESGYKCFDAQEAWEEMGGKIFER